MKQDALCAGIPRPVVPGEKPESIAGGSSPPPAPTFFLLLETGDRLLLETGDKLVKEDG